MHMNRRHFGLGLGVAFTAAIAAIGLVGAPADASVRTGGAIPAFSVQSTDGSTITQAYFAGKAVVFEWTNHDCPFVKKHYNTQNMQRLMDEAKAQNVVWVQVVSSAPGQQGHVDIARARALNTQRTAAPSLTLMDPTGAMGRAFDAKTTPHMFVFDAAGKLTYQGAIDDNRGRGEDTVAGARNYVREALSAMRAGQTPAVQVTQAYGCSVKYAPG
jgi:peroxiredoxin